MFSLLLNNSERMKLICSLLLIILVFTIDISAQPNSVYSRFGAGDPEYNFSARRMGMGGLGYAVRDNQFISFENPASISRITMTRLELGTKINNSFLNDANESSSDMSAYFSGLGIAFPVSPANGIVFALGLTPYSVVQYESEEVLRNGNLPGEEYTYLYSGEGGLSRAFITGTYHVPLGFDIGMSAEYMFGEMAYRSNLYFLDPTLYDVEYETIRKGRGFALNTGVISDDLSSLLDIENVDNVHVGLALSLGHDLDADSVYLSKSIYDFDTTSVGETTMRIPFRLGAGLSFSYKPENRFLLDFVFQPWSDFRFNNASDDNVQDSWKISAGYEYKKIREPNSLVEHTAWRLGISYEQTPYQINGEGINALSISGGLSVPLSLENTLDLALRFMMRGSTDNGLVNEKVITLGVGFSFGELWFVRNER